MKRHEKNIGRVISHESIKIIKSKIPDVLKIGYQDVRIILSTPEEEKLLEDSQGFYDGKHSEIVIKDSVCMRERINTLLHEILHAAYYTYGMREILDDKEKEEYACNNLGNALTQVFRDNPALLDWIKENI